MNAIQALEQAGYTVNEAIIVAADRIGYSSEDERAQVMLSVILYGEFDAKGGALAPWEPMGLEA